jgi:hypothetical protein
MRIAIAALVILTGAAQAQLRSPSLSEKNDKLINKFQKQNEKTRQAIAIPARPGNLRPEAPGGPHAARDAVDRACKKAAAESKMVFMWIGAPPCGSCVAFFHYHGMNEVDSILSKYYVVLQIDPVYMPDARATFARYAESPHSFWLILSPQKKVIADSLLPPLGPGAPVRGAGYPLKRESMDHYCASLRKATPAITEDEVRWLCLHIRKAVDMPNPWDSGARRTLRASP